MSARSNITVREQGSFPESGATVKTVENSDITNGNKVVIEPRLNIVFFNSAVAARTITATYDDDSGVERTKVIATLQAGEMIQCQLESRLGRHASDLPEMGFAWLTSSGIATDVKIQATRLKGNLG